MKGITNNSSNNDPVKMMEDNKRRESMLKLLSPTCKQFGKIYDNYEETERRIDSLWDGGSVC